ncbi:MAG: type II secretion system protein J [Myxococcota bacterium]
MRRRPRQQTGRAKPQRARPNAQLRAGFTLIELVVVIALVGILSVGLAEILRNPMQGYIAVSRRAELVALADLTLNRMTRDLRRALPNSIRVAGGGQVLELLHTVDGARYRADPGINDPGGAGEEDHTAATDWLSFGGDTRFNILGRFQNLGVSPGSALPGGTRLAIYPTGTSVWSDAALGSNPGTITPSTTLITLNDDSDEDQLQLGVAHRFPLASPSQRAYLVDTPVTYLCDSSTETLWRIDGYAAAAAQPTARAAAPLSAGTQARTTDLVEQCVFDYSPGTPSRSGLVTLEIVLEQEGERVRLLQQVQVFNAP